MPIKSPPIPLFSLSLFFFLFTPHPSHLFPFIEKTFKTHFLTLAIAIDLKSTFTIDSLHHHFTYTYTYTDSFSLSSLHIHRIFFLHCKTFKTRFLTSPIESIRNRLHHPNRLHHQFTYTYTNTDSFAPPLPISFQLTSRARLITHTQNKFVNKFPSKEKMAAIVSLLFLLHLIVSSLILLSFFLFFL